jgi:methionyl-tRNA synthetase
MPSIEQVDEDGGPSYPVITGRHDGAARWASQPVRPGTPLAVPAPLFAKLGPEVVDEELARLGAS